MKPAARRRKIRRRQPPLIPNETVRGQSTRQLGYASPLTWFAVIGVVPAANVSAVSIDSATSASARRAICWRVLSTQAAGPVVIAYSSSGRCGR
ncbi:MAG: hypothetical protein ACLP8S_06310 [Solirubrobacteraceae bacterium]